MDVEARLELEAGRGFEDALRDIEGFDYLWLISVFHRADGFRPTVLPPRSDLRRGVFATRAPRRPNPIGLTVVRLVRREGLTLFIAEVDLLDGTPILDIKPYVAWADAIPKAATGWLERPADPGMRFSVDLSQHAESQFTFIAEHDEDIRRRVIDHLAIGPRPHAYRRIRKEGDAYVLSVGAWRVCFSVQGAQVKVTHLRSGERNKHLNKGTSPVPHLRFVERFGRDGKRQASSSNSP